MDLHPEFIFKNGRKTAVLLPYREFKALQEKLQDLEDLHLLNEAKKNEGHLKKVPLTKVKNDLGL